MNKGRQSLVVSDQLQVLSDFSFVNYHYLPPPSQPGVGQVKPHFLHIVDKYKVIYHITCACIYY